MNKKPIRLTESDLHRIVRESVNKILNEVKWKDSFGSEHSTHGDNEKDWLEVAKERKRRVDKIDPSQYGYTIWDLKDEYFDKFAKDNEHMFRDKANAMFSPTTRKIEPSPYLPSREDKGFDFKRKSKEWRDIRKGGNIRKGGGK